MTLILNIYGTPCIYKGKIQICKDPLGFIELLKSHPQDDFELANKQSASKFVEYGIADLAKPFKQCGWYCTILKVLADVYSKDPVTLVYALRTPDYWSKLINYEN